MFQSLDIVFMIFTIGISLVCCISQYLCLFACHSAASTRGEEKSKEGKSKKRDTKACEFTLKAETKMKTVEQFSCWAFGPPFPGLKGVIPQDGNC